MSNKNIKKEQTIVMSADFSYLIERRKKAMKKIISRLGWEIIPGFEEIDGTILIEMPDTEEEKNIFETLCYMI